MRWAVGMAFSIPMAAQFAIARVRLARSLFLLQSFVLARTWDWDFQCSRIKFNLFVVRSVVRGTPICHCSIKAFQNSSKEEFFIISRRSHFVATLVDSVRSIACLAWSLVAAYER